MNGILNQLSERFLSLSSLKVFLLSLLGVPMYLWLFSIIYQLDNKRNNKTTSLRKLGVILLVLYPIMYLMVFIVLFFGLFGGSTYDYLGIIMPFHISAMLCGFLLIILAARSYKNFEGEKGYKTYDTTAVFFLLWFSFVGIWILQPHLNKYIRE